MEPNYYGYSTGGGNTRGRRTNPKLAIILAVVGIVILAIGIFAFSDNRTPHDGNFRLDNASPKSSDVTTLTSKIDFTFSDNISQDNLLVSSSPAIVSNYKANGKTLSVDLITPLNKGTKYTITIKSIANTSGQQLLNVPFSFTPTEKDFQDLPKDQQQSILQQQASRPPSRDNYTYQGIDQLTSNGLTEVQVNDLKQALFQYFQAKKLDVQTVAFSNVSLAPAHPDQPFAPDVTPMTITFNGVSYTAKLACNDLATGRLYLYDQAGNLLYDSKDINVTQNTINQ